VFSAPVAESFACNINENVSDDLFQLSWRRQFRAACRLFYYTMSISTYIGLNILLYTSIGMLCRQSREAAVTCDERVDREDRPDSGLY